MTTTTSSIRGTQLRAAIVRLLDTEPHRTWRGVEIAGRLDSVRLIDVLVALPILTADGELERVRPGSYRRPTGAVEN